MPPKRPKYSRYGRLPGIRRITELRIPGPEADLERLTLYLPGGVLDQAMVLAKSAGAESLQMFCEELLRSAVEAAQVGQRPMDVESSQGPWIGFDAIANDPDYLAEWSASVQAPAAAPNLALDPPRPGPERAIACSGRSRAEIVVLRHANLEGDDSFGLLSTLRRGEAITAEATRELLQALVELEAEKRGADQLDRKLSYALHRLAFEGQVLLTDVFPGLGADTSTLETLRMVQQGVDRVLSGEDIRYYSEERPGRDADSSTENLS